MAEIVEAMSFKRYIRYKDIWFKIKTGRNTKNVEKEREKRNISLVTSRLFKIFKAFKTNKLLNAK